ncbi:SCO family protein [Undibacterium squillarum]|uniref:SCO family protein n=1 Tax=Undibacterium squillarum TaxID=1131567 RepID=UPI0035B3519D
MTFHRQLRCGLLMLALSGASTPALTAENAATPTAASATRITTSTNAITAPQSWPEDSVYQLDLTLQTQTGQQVPLSVDAGSPVLVSMFYNSCEYVCPMLIETLQMTEAALTKRERAKLKMMLVSFDPARDDVAALKNIQRQRRLDQRWIIARSDEDSVRSLSVALGIQYRQLESGEFNHSTAIILLGSDGRILAKTTKLADTDPAFIKVLKQTLQANGKQGGAKSKPATNAAP